jgi:hypothetical protein
MSKCNGFDRMVFSKCLNIEEFQESNSEAEGKCIGAKAIIYTLTTAAYGLSNDGIVLFFFYIISIVSQLSK